MAGKRGLGRLFGRGGREPEPPRADVLDARTLAMLEPGRREFRAMQTTANAVVIDVAPGEASDLGPIERVTIDATHDALLGIAPEHALAWAAAHVAAGGWVEIEVPNASVAALDDLVAGVTLDQLTTAIADAGLAVAEAYGIGYVPQSLAAGERFNAELARNPGVYATPAECVLLAYRCRKPLDATA
jgi:hypothetical protein